jgi:glycosyltransferase involved in cell wall biosynthesis
MMIENKKILLIGPARSIHLARWANSFVKIFQSVHIITLHNQNISNLNSKIIVHKLKYKAPIGYVLNYAECKSLIDDIGPDIINVHYATGYGLLASLIKKKPILLSVWGSDVYDFPNKSFFHKLLVKSNLRSATAVASTSESMGKQVSSLVPEIKSHITPFGIDTDLFQKTCGKTDSKKVIIGTVKSLEHIYGIDLLIHAFEIATRKLEGEIDLFLEITGAGSERSKYEKMVKNFDLAGKVKFNGFVEHELVVSHLNKLDIYVALSRYESFGVAILEASACEIPVIVSDADGPSEVTIDNVTGFVVPNGEVISVADVIIKLARDSKLRKKIGQNARKHVLENYSWESSVSKMVDIYSNFA